jgi:thiol-disulfide isomerase/thioredoxin
MKHSLRLLILTLMVPVVSAGVSAERTKSEKPERIALGEQVKLEDFLVPGKTVVFDFTSPFCPPCRAIAPHLDKLHETRDDIVVIAVDINRPKVRGIDWESPVAQQYRIESVPQFKVYTPDGKLQAEGKKAEKLVFGWMNYSWPDN